MIKKLALIACAFASLVGSSFADDTRFYDSNGQYQGRASDEGAGNYRFYDANGQYQGRAASENDGGYRYYDQDGQYQGRSQPQ